MSEATISGAVALSPTPHGLTLQSVGDEQYYRKVTGTPRTAFVHLHTWSGVKEECLVGDTPGSQHAFQALQNCVWVCPHFGGPNNHPQGAGHPAQLERIKRVIDRTLLQYPMVERIILFGLSGGGYTSLMFMAAYPGLVYGASLWVFPYDLADWWAKGPPQVNDYKEMLEACMGGTPAQVPAEYVNRSPLSKTVSGVRLYFNASPDDVATPYRHQEAARVRFKDSNDLTFRSFSGGHKAEWDVAIAQIQAMQPA